jgi:hypothetical protein
MTSVEGGRVIRSTAFLVTKFDRLAHFTYNPGQEWKGSGLGFWGFPIFERLEVAMRELPVLELGADWIPDRSGLIVQMIEDFVDVKELHVEFGSDSLSTVSVDRKEPRGVVRHDVACGQCCLGMQCPCLVVGTRIVHYIDFRKHQKMESVVRVMERNIIVFLWRRDVWDCRRLQANRGHGRRG